jgi:phosphohistidine phosphatase
MKTLLILRHGKAQPYNDESDKSRSLADRGVKDAKRMGELIAEMVGTIDAIVSSDAARAAETARLAAQGAGYTKKIQFNPDMYGASSHALLGVVRSTAHDVETLLLVGHNPGLEELCADISGKSITECTLPTCGLARIELPGTWKEASIDSGTLKGLWTPK